LPIKFCKNVPSALKISSRCRKIRRKPKTGDYFLLIRTELLGSGSYFGLLCCSAANAAP